MIEPSQVSDDGPIDRYVVGDESDEVDIAYGSDPAGGSGDTSSRRLRQSLAEADSDLGNPMDADRHSLELTAPQPGPRGRCGVIGGLEASVTVPSVGPCE